MSLLVLVLLVFDNIMPQSGDYRTTVPFDLTINFMVISCFVRCLTPIMIHSHANYLLVSCTPLFVKTQVSVTYETIQESTKTFAT